MPMAVSFRGPVELSLRTDAQVPPQVLLLSVWLGVRALIDHKMAFLSLMRDYSGNTA
jgi:hypothetical protein